MTLQDELEHKEQWKKISQKELDEVLDKHENFVTGQRDGERAQLGMHDLSYLDMANRNLSRAELTGAILNHCGSVNRRRGVVRHRKHKRQKNCR